MRSNLVLTKMKLSGNRQSLHKSTCPLVQRTAAFAKKLVYVFSWIISEGANKYINYGVCGLLQNGNLNEHIMFYGLIYLRTDRMVPKNNVRNSWTLVIT